MGKRWWPTTSVRNTISEINRSQSFGSKYRIVETDIEQLSSAYTSIESHERRHKSPRDRSVSSSTTMSQNYIVMDDDQRRNLQEQANNNLLIQQQRLRDQRNAERNQLNVSGISNNNIKIGFNAVPVRPTDYVPAFNIRSEHNINHKSFNNMNSNQQIQQ